jgi:transposase-like protein
MLAAELNHHLTAEAVQQAAGNHRNGTSPKTVITPGGELQLDIPRDLKPIYQAPNAEAAAGALKAFAQGQWGQKFPTVAAMWQRQWEQVIPFFAYPPEVRKIVYTTNAIESLHMQLRKIVKNRGHFPSDDAATKLLFLALRNIEKDWKMPPVTWKQAANQFAILFGERFTNALN